MFRNSHLNLPKSRPRKNFRSRAAEAPSSSSSEWLLSIVSVILVVVSVLCEYDDWVYVRGLT